MDELQIEILDSIGGWGFSFRDLYAKAKDFKGKKIRLPVNTYGGDAFQGLLIYNYLKGHQAEVEIHIPAYACSAGTMIAAAGDRVSIAENGFYMIHNPIGAKVGESEDMERTAQLLKDLTNSMVDMYHDKTGMDKERIRSMMDKETWLPAKDALAMGFVDVLTKGAKIQANADLKASFNNVPDELVKERAKSQANNQNSFQMNELQIIAGFLGLNADAKMLEVQNAITDMNAKVKNLTTENATLKAENKQYKEQEEQVQKDQAKELLNAAINDERITNEQRPHLESVFNKDFETGKNLLATFTGKVKKLSKVPKNEKGGKLQATTYLGKTYKELDKENPAALAELKEHDFDTFNALFKASYGVDYEDK